MRLRDAILTISGLDHLRDDGNPYFFGSLTAYGQSYGRVHSLDVFLAEALSQE